MNLSSDEMTLSVLNRNHPFNNEGCDLSVSRQLPRPTNVHIGSMSNGPTTTTLVKLPAIASTLRRRKSPRPILLPLVHLPAEVNGNGLPRRD